VDGTWAVSPIDSWRRTTANERGEGGREITQLVDLRDARRRLSLALAPRFEDASASELSP